MQWGLKRFVWRVISLHEMARVQLFIGTQRSHSRTPGTKELIVRPSSVIWWWH